MDETITVYGTARRRVTPDTGVWHAVVEGRGADERQAYAACAAQLSAVHSAVRSATTTAEVAAGGVWVQPEWSESGQRRVGFLGTATVVIRDRVEALEGLGQAAMAAGAVRLDGPSYEVAQVLAIQDELGAEAVAAAKVRASALAGAAGREVGQVVTIVDGMHQGSPAFGGAEMQVMRTAKMDVGPVSPEAQELQVDVTVTYLLR